MTSDVIFSRGVKPLNALSLIGTGIPGLSAARFSEGGEASTATAELSEVSFSTATNAKIVFFLFFFYVFNVHWYLKGSLFFFFYSQADAWPSSVVRTAWRDEIISGGRERMRRFPPFLRGHPGLAWGRMSPRRAFLASVSRSLRDGGLS